MVKASQLGQLLSSIPHPAAKAVGLGTIGVSKTSDIVTEKFGYDFLGLAVKIVMFYAVAYLIQIYIQGKIQIEGWIRNPATIPSDLAGAGFFGLGGLIINFIWNKFSPDQQNIPTITPETSNFWNNDSLKALFSEDGFHGLQFWDVIKIVSLLLVFMEWQRFKKSQSAIGAQISPLTSGMFMLFIIAIGLTIVPDIMKRLRKLNLGAVEA